MNLPDHRHFVEFDFRDDGGPMRIGPFETALAAELFMQTYVGRVGEKIVWRWSVKPLFTPEGALDG